VPFLLPDLSDYQGSHTTADFLQAKAGGADALMFKATQGSSFVAHTFVSNVAAANGAGLPWGAYHYVDGTDGPGQASHFWAVVRPLNPVFICIDWEKESRVVATSILTELLKAANCPVTVYSGAHARDNGGPPDASPSLMIPAYGPSAVTPYIPTGWSITQVAAWQYTNGVQNGTQNPTRIPGLNGGDISEVYRPELLGLIEGADMPDARVDAILAGLADYLNDTPPGPGATAAEARTYKALRDAASKPVATGTSGLSQSQLDARYAAIVHAHAVKGSAS